MSLDSEDPRVIKELIDLIKKVGGIEELEKQLNYREDGSVALKSSKNQEITTTPATISKSLFEKILSRTSGNSVIASFKNRPNLSTTNVPEQAPSETVPVRTSQYSSINRGQSNSRGGPQNAGLEKLPELEALIKDKPQYVTITRTRPPVIRDQEEEEPLNLDEEEQSEDDEEGESSNRSSSTEPTFVRYTLPQQQQYVNIQRHRPAPALEENDEESLSQQIASSTPYVTIFRTTTTNYRDSEDDAISPVMR